MKLNGIQSLYNDMRGQSIDRYRFDYKNGKGHFDIFFFIDEKPFILLFGAKEGNFSFEVQVKKGFEIQTMLDKETFNKLLDFLGIKYTSENLFSTNKFFQKFNQNIPTSAKLSNIPKPQQVIKYRKNVEESEKIYFWKWLDNTKQDNNVSEANLEKTKQIMKDIKRKILAHAGLMMKAKKKQLHYHKDNKSEEPINYPSCNLLTHFKH